MSRRGRTAVARLAAGALLVGCTMLLAPQQASACDVSYGYKPSVSFSDLSHPRTCSTGTSVSGVVVLAVLALGALAAAGLLVFRRGERELGASSAGAPSQALSAYWEATGTAPRETSD